MKRRRSFCRCTGLPGVLGSCAAIIPLFFCLFVHKYFPFICTAVVVHPSMLFREWDPADCAFSVLFVPPHGGQTDRNVACPIREAKVRTLGLTSAGDNIVVKPFNNEVARSSKSSVRWRGEQFKLSTAARM